MEFATITIQALINADIKKVWNYWTNPQHIINWNFASNDWQCPKAENDVQVGGKYAARMEAKDGSFGFDFTAIYNQVIHLETLIYTMEDGRQATTTFNNQQGKTIVTTTFDAETENPIEMQQAGWQSILNNFKKYTEEN
ncbi:MAG: SRPBCC family protein [Chitinophagaceae bacterium]|nr:SRPBCC family protein [Chitinophagaceae bacterium]